MEKDWVCIYSTSKSYAAEIAKDVLIEHDIESVIIDKQDSTYLFGTLEVYVNRNNAIRGKHLLKELES